MAQPLSDSIGKGPDPSSLGEISISGIHEQEKYTEPPNYGLASPDLDECSGEELIKSADTSTDSVEDLVLPTKDELESLRKVPGAIPWVAWLLCFVELAERASYYGARQVFANFLQQPLPPGSKTGAALKITEHKEVPAGALGMGLQFTTAMLLLYGFAVCTIPVFGAWLGDVKIGRYNAIMLGVAICGVSHIIQIFGAMPVVLQRHQGLGPFLASLFLLAIGAGILKPNILPTVLDQYPNQKSHILTLKTGERVLVDPELTLQRINLWFYWAVNAGGFFGIVTSYSARHVGFWLAFLLPGIVYFMLPILLLCIKKKLIHQAPKENELSTFFRIIGIAIKKNKFNPWKKNFWDVVKPSVLATQGITTINNKPITWNDRFVTDVQRTLGACAMFLYFPLWTLSNGGIGSVVISMASSLTTKGQPNDVLWNFNPLTIMLFVPLLSQVIYPALQKHKLMPGRITRISFGFFLATICGAVGAILQWYIYQTSPCGDHATGCRIGGRVSPISVWVQTPIFVLSAMSECFVVVTGCEIAYARSPKNLKAVVLSFFILVGALSSALAQILVPVTKDPFLVWIWAGPTVVLAVATVQFWWAYRWMNKDDFMTHEEGNDQ